MRHNPKDLKRYKELKKILIDHCLYEDDIARAADCTQPAVSYFINGHTNSKKVARAFASLTGEYERVASIINVPVQELKDAA